MTCRLYAISFDAGDPAGLGRFWAGMLGWATEDEPRGGVVIGPAGDTGFRIWFPPSPAPKTGPNRSHLELTSDTAEHQQRTVQRALDLGGRHIDVGQLPHETHIVLADPGGNEFCVLGPGNKFLAGCGFLGDLAADGTRAVGLFWSAALGWPLVWDQDEETAIQSPRGGPKIAWGGPPLMHQDGRDRVRLDLLLDGEAEVERLVSLGATRLGPDTMADPDGTEFTFRMASKVPQS